MAGGKVVVYNKLYSDRTVLSCNFESLPVGLYVRKGMAGVLYSFFYLYNDQFYDAVAKVEDIAAVHRLGAMEQRMKKQ